jgi:hypothetical protein
MSSVQANTVPGTRLKPLNLLLPILLLLVLFGLSYGAAQHDSGIMDEPPNLVAGHYLWKTGHYNIDREHPPLARLIEALPLLFLPVEMAQSNPDGTMPPYWPLSVEFLYENTVPAPRMLMPARLMVMGLSVLLGAFLWWWGNQLFGPPAGVIALLMCTLNPLILAHGHLATTDLAIALTFPLALACLSKYAGHPSTRNAVVAGIGLGVALATKGSAVLLLPIYLFILAWTWRKQPPSGWVFLKHGGACLAAALAVLTTVYWGDLGAFFASVREVLFHSAAGHENYLLGRLSISGSPIYFLVAFLLKNPIPFLILLATAALLVRRSPHRELVSVWLIFPSLLFFFVASLSDLQIGLRHLLPIFPLLFLIVGELGGRLWRQKRPAPRLVLGLLSAWMAVDIAVAHPHYIAYFNQLIGDPDSAIDYLADSNLDWGQELRHLDDFLRDEGIGGVYLSYFGNADPEAYGIRYLPVYYESSRNRLGDPTLDLRDEARALLAVSATHLQGVYRPTPEAFAWLSSREPTAILGRSLFLYDLTDDEDAHRRLATIFLEQQMPGPAQIEREWADRLQSEAIRE